MLDEHAEFRVDLHHLCACKEGHPEHLTKATHTRLSVPTPHPTGMHSAAIAGTNTTFPVCGLVGFNTVLSFSSHLLAPPVARVSILIPAPVPSPARSPSPPSHPLCHV